MHPRALCRSARENGRPQSARHVNGVSLRGDIYRPAQRSARQRALFGVLFDTAAGYESVCPPERITFRVYCTRLTGRRWINIYTLELGYLDIAHWVKLDLETECRTGLGIIENCFVSDVIRDNMFNQLLLAKYKFVVNGKKIREKWDHKLASIDRLISNISNNINYNHSFRLFEQLTKLQMQTNSTFHFSIYWNEHNNFFLNFEHDFRTIAHHEYFEFYSALLSRKIKRIALLGGYVFLYSIAGVISGAQIGGMMSLCSSGMKLKTRLWKYSPWTETPSAKQGNAIELGLFGHIISLPTIITMRFAANSFCSTERSPNSIGRRLVRFSVQSINACAAIGRFLDWVEKRNFFLLEFNPREVRIWD